MKPWKNALAHAENVPTNAAIVQAIVKTNRAWKSAWNYAWSAKNYAFNAQPIVKQILNTKWNLLRPVLKPAKPAPQNAKSITTLLARNVLKLVEHVPKYVIELEQSTKSIRSKNQKRG